LRFPFKNWRPPNGLCDLRPVENNGPKSRMYHGTVEHSGISAVRCDASSIPIFELFVESGAHDTRIKSGVGWRFKGGIDMERHAILLTSHDASINSALRRALPGCNFKTLSRSVSQSLSSSCLTSISGLRSRLFLFSL
jgi:hypothetical protein